MKYTIQDFADAIEEKAPLSSQESYDNSGLIVGNPTTEVEGVLISFDCVEETIQEAIALGANLIIAHHPIIFKGIKKFNGKNYVERTVMMAIKNDIAIYAAHTNLDNSRWGVNHENARRLGVPNPKILAPKKNVLKHLVFYCPTHAVEKVEEAIFKAGAGSIGEYKNCSFKSDGIGQFTPTGNANPTEGSLDQVSQVEEKRIEVLISSHQEKAILQAMKTAHPYEEVAHQIYPITNYNQSEGAGMVGELEKEMDVLDFLQQIKENYNCGIIRHTKLVHQKIKRVAFCGGSGSFLLPDAIRAKADIFITGDFKYHEFFDAESHIIIADIGHYESEQFTTNLIFDRLTKKFINFAIHLSKVNTNPINYF